MSKHGTVRVTEAETVELINAATRGAVLPLRFGASGVFLDLDAAPYPILKRLADLRAAAKEPK